MSQNKDPLRSPEAAALLKDSARLRELLRSPETRQLMEMLSSGNDGSLQQAAEQARKGDTSGLTAMMNRLMSSRDGAALVEQIRKKVQK